MALRLDGGSTDTRWSRGSRLAGGVQPAQQMIGDELGRVLLQPMPGVWDHLAHAQAGHPAIHNRRWHEPTDRITLAGEEQRGLCDPPFGHRERSAPSCDPGFGSSSVRPESRSA